MVNANTRRFFVSDNPAIFIRLFLLTNQRQVWGTERNVY